MNNTPEWLKFLQMSLATADGSTQSPAPQYAGLRPMVVQWEGLRIVYNLVLTAEVLILLMIAGWNGTLHFGIPQVDGLIVAAVAANVCFCAGPLADLYLTAILRFRAPLIRVLFPLGLLLSVVLAPLVLNSILEIGLDH